VYLVDWDGIGAFALFLSSGAVGLGLIALRAYKAKLASKLEWERLRRSDPAPDEVLEQLQDLEAKVQRLAERADFTERLVGDGRSEPADSEKVV
jgi:hypothetical protein